MIRKTAVPVLVLAAILAAGMPAWAQQASLTLKDSNAELCHHNSTGWSLAKSGVYNDGTVTWTVTVTKGAVSNNFLSANGYVRIQNTGTANATIGNIVVNLQRKSGKNWLGQSCDIADATLGDAAVKAKIVSGASSEGKSVFDENAASGPLELRTASNNSVFSLVPQLVLPPAAFIDLLFSATFDNTILGIPEGESVRLEVIVTFGNSGPRGGSGASGTNIDINGDGLINADEHYVRSVPTRITRGVPELEECAQSVTLADLASSITKSGTVTLQDPVVALGTLTVSESGVYTFTTGATGGANGGTVRNVATLTSLPDSLTVLGPIDPITLQPKYSYSFECCPGFVLTAAAEVTIPKVNPPSDDPPPPPPVKKYTTYTQGGWGSTPHGNNPGMLLKNNFAAVYPSGVEVGIPGAAGFSMKFSAASKIEAFLPNGSTAGALDSDLINPTSSSAGVFGAQVLALQLGVDFSNAGVTQTGLGALKLKGTGTSLDGMTISEILAIANQVLGGAAPLADYTIPELSGLIASFNEAFDNGSSVLPSFLE